jgi:outer membrane lipoprotein-sorting protein
MTSGNTLRAVLAAVLLGLGIGVAVSNGIGAARAGGNDGGWGLPQLMADLARVKKSQVTFTQRKFMKVLTSPLETSGTLVYTAPNRLEKHTLLPKPESMVVDQDTLTLENPVRHQRRVLALQDYPAVWAFVESIRATLAGNQQALARFYRTALEGGPEHWRLVLTPKELSMQALVTRIRIDGGGARIERIEIDEADGDISVMTMGEERTQ